MWHVYILECDDGSFYTGITTDLERRLSEHKNKKGGNYTRSRTVLKRVYSEACKGRSEALKRESQIKSWRHDKKILLISGKITDR